MKKLILILIVLLIPASSFAWRFAVLGDSRGADNIHKSLLNIAKQWSADPVFNTGDIITHPGNLKEWKDTWKVIGKQPFDYFFAAGNHDIKNKKSERIWQEQVNFPGNELYYKIVKNGVLFVVLDSVEPNAYKKITGEQLAWLKKTLDPKKYKHQFIFLHHPLFLQKNFKHYGNSLDQYPKLRDQLHQLFLAKGVTAVFEGHEHTYDRQIVDGLNYIIAGGGGAPLYGGFCHIVIVDVLATKLRFRIIDWHGTTRYKYYLN